MKIAVLGSGGWGTALAMLLAENGHAVTLWSYLPEESEALRTRKENQLLPGVRLPEGMEYTSDLSCVEGSRVVVFATPSFALRVRTSSMRPHMYPSSIMKYSMNIYFSAFSSSSSMASNMVSPMGKYLASVRSKSGKQPLRLR